MIWLLKAYRECVVLGIARGGVARMLVKGLMLTVLLPVKDGGNQY